MIKKNDRFFILFLLILLFNLTVYSAFATLFPSKEIIRTINMDRAEIMVRDEFGNTNDLNIIISDVKGVLKKYEKESNYKEVELFGNRYIDNSYLFLVMMSLAYKESRFSKSVIGSYGEVGEFQLMPSTVRYLLKINSLPISKGKKETLRTYIKKNNATIAFFYFKQHLDKYNNLVMAASRYNGDMKTKKYGRDIQKTLYTISKNIV